MRKTAIALLALGLATILVAPAGAVSLLSETFNSYTVGPLVPQGGWAMHSGAVPDIQVVQLSPGNKAAFGDNNLTPDDNKAFAPGQTGKVYACFMAMIPTVVGTPRTTYIVHFKDGTTTNYSGRVGIAPSGSTFAWALGATAFNASTAPPVVWPTACNYNQWYKIVVSYNNATAVGELWVNPVNESSQKITQTGTPYTNYTISAIALRESGDGSGTKWTYYVDNIGVGTTFTDACNAGPTPTLETTWGRLKTIYR